MANTSLLNTVWSARLLFNLKANLVFGNVVSTDYEGDAANSATVKINSISGITVGDYDASTGMATPEDVTSVSQDLNIDQHKFFNFKVEDLLKAQTKIAVVDAAMAEAASGLGEAVDKYIAGKYTELTPLQSVAIDSASKAYDTIVDVGVALSEANVPKSNRFIVFPEFVGGMIAKDSRWTLNQAVLTNGVMGYNVNGMTVYFSNNVANVGGSYKVIAGDKRAIAYVGALKTMESYRPEAYFADAVKGQIVFGCKVIKPTALVLQPITKA